MQMVWLVLVESRLLLLLHDEGDGAGGDVMRFERGTTDEQRIENLREQVKNLLEFIHEQISHHMDCAVDGNNKGCDCGINLRLRIASYNPDDEATAQEGEQ